MSTSEISLRTTSFETPYAFNRRASPWQVLPRPQRVKQLSQLHQEPQQLAQGGVDAMSHSRRLLLNEFFKGVDLFLMVATFGLLAWKATQQDLFSPTLSFGNFFLFIAMMFGWHLIFQTFGLYGSQRQLSRADEATKVVGATTVGSLSILLIGFVSNIELITANLAFISMLWLISSSAIIGSRLLIRAVLEQARMHGRNLRHVLIIGTNQRALAFAQAIETRPKLGYRVVGFVDDDWAGLGSFRGSGRQRVADFAGLKKFLASNVVDEVINALPLRASFEQSSRILGMCAEQGIPVRFLSPIFNVKLDRARLDTFFGEPVITFSNQYREDGRQLGKRLLDLAVSVVALLALAPLFLVVALAIKLTSPGPVFFVQERMGLNKRRFKLIKFRTMVQDAEKQLGQLAHLNEVSGPVFKIKKDPRITRVGAFLRKTSIDELPQLLNVFWGDMSLVGPRPLPLRDCEGFDQDWHRRRFSVRPGITCLWQVEGRSSIPFERWMELDMKYIDTWSLWLDFKILLRTIPVVLTGQGAA